MIAVWPLPATEAVTGRSGPSYLHGVGDPGNVGTIVRTADALAGARGRARAGVSADAYSPKAVRASMGAVFAAPPIRAELAATPVPRLALIAHGRRRRSTRRSPPSDRSGPLSWGPSARACRREVEVACDATATIPLREGAESLNVAAAAAIALQRIRLGCRRLGATG